MSAEEPRQGHYWHPRNLTYGDARVIWSTTYGQVGFVLPGGRVTQSESEAMQAAKAINALIQAHKRRAA